MHTWNLSNIFLFFALKAETITPTSSKYYFPKNIPELLYQFFEKYLFSAAYIIYKSAYLEINETI